MFEAWLIGFNLAWRHTVFYYSCEKPLKYTNYNSIVKKASSHLGHCSMKRHILQQIGKVSAHCTNCVARVYQESESNFFSENIAQMNCVHARCHLHHKTQMRKIIAAFHYNRCSMPAHCAHFPINRHHQRALL